jgi:hypothetical protein
MIAIGAIFFVFALILLGVLALGYYPKAEQDEPVTQLDDAPLLSRQQAFKVLSYNVQFMAGKDYTFWFDVPEADGPDSQPSTDAIKKQSRKSLTLLSMKTQTSSFYKK